MRKIKFRAFIVNTPSGFKPNRMDYFGSNKTLFEWEEDGVGMHIMQSTGLHDKNGKEIYEGDIVSVCNGSINGMEWMEKNYAVEFKAGKYNIHLFLWDKDGNPQMDSTHWIEVIGNIYENPELLQ